MGPRSSKQIPDEIDKLSKNLLNQLSFPKVGQKFQKAQFFYKTKQMKIHIPVEDQKQIKLLNQNIQLIHQHQMKSYILIPKSYQFQKLGYCGTSGIAKIVYDYFPYSLEGQIANRKKSINNQEFQQSQIWKLLFILLKGAHFMHKNWKKVGDIRPKNIFYNQQKQLRVSYQYSYPNQLTNYQKFIYEKQPCYISPQQIHDIKMGRIQPNITRNAKQYIIQSQSWSIGLTILHVILLFDFQIIYNPIDVSINLDLLQQKIVDLENKKNLSPALKNIVKSMLEDIPERRLLANQLITDYIQPYQQSINKFQKFDTTQLNNQIKSIMIKKAQNSLIGTIWKACNTGLIQSLVIARKQTERLDTQTRAKQNFMRQIQKFSQIQPKNSQVSMRQSIRLGRSRKKMTQSNVVNPIKQSQVSSQSFHTVNSFQYSKKDFNSNRIVGFQIQNRFGQQRIPTSGSIVSPRKYNNVDNMSDKFMTPNQQSYFFHTLHGNQKSFDFNSLGPLNSTFRISQAAQNKNFFNQINQKMNQNIKIQVQGNFKKQKSKQKK